MLITYTSHVRRVPEERPRRKKKYTYIVYEPPAVRGTSNKQYFSIYEGKTKKKKKTEISIYTCGLAISTA